MSKKNRKKHNKNKSLSWAKFVRSFCSRCSICNTRINAKFCYKRYKHDPEGWKSNVFPFLSKEPIYLDDDFGGMSVFDFEDLFCEHCKEGNYTKKESCREISVCLYEFDKQVRASQSCADDYHKPKKKVKPEPVFFTNNPEKWDIIIRRVLYGETYEEEEN